MLRFDRGGRSYVLRRGPRHLRAKSNEVIRRESVLLRALDGTEVRAPRVIAACTDESVIGAVFYLMEPIVGFNLQNELPDLHAGDPEIRRQMGLSAVEAIARLGAIDYRAIGLSDYGKPEGFLERQVPRWLGELESYSANAGYPGPEIPGVTQVGEWLERNRPQRWTPGILHGDCHLANIMFTYDGPEVAALVDWEMSTIGDPLLDLGWQARHPTGAGDNGFGAGRQTRRRGWTADAGGDDRALRPVLRSGSERRPLVHGARVLQTRHRARGDARARLCGRSAQAGRRFPARGHAGAVREGVRAHGVSVRISALIG